MRGWRTWIWPTSLRRIQCTMTMTKPWSESKTANRIWKRMERLSVMASTADIQVSARSGKTTQELQREALREERMEKLSEEWGRVENKGTDGGRDVGRYFEGKKMPTLRTKKAPILHDWISLQQSTIWIPRKLMKAHDVKGYKHRYSHTRTYMQYKDARNSLFGLNR